MLKDSIIDFQNLNTQTIINSLSDAIWVIDTNYKIIAYNDFFKNEIKKATGFKVKKGVSVKYIAPDDFENFWKLKYDKAFLGEAIVFEYFADINNYFEIKLNPTIIDNTVVALTAMSINVFERKKAEIEPQNNEEHFQRFKNSNLEGVVFSSGGLIHEVNKQYAKMLNYSLTEFIDKPIEDIVHPDDLNIVLDKIKEGDENSYNIRLLKKGGEIFYASVKAKNTFYKGIKGRIASIYDITNIKTAEKKLDFQTELLTNISNGAIIVDTNNKITYWNHYAEKLHQWTSAEAIGKDFTSLLVPKEKITESTKKNTNKVNHTWDGECRLKRKDGSLIDVLISHTILKDENGEPTGTLGISTDISERKLAESNLLESYNIINTSPVIVFLWGNKDHWDVKFVSKNVSDLLGYNTNDFFLNKTSFKDLIHPEDFDHISKELLTFYTSKKKKKLTQEYRVITKDGTIKWVRDFPSIKRDENNNIIHFTAVLQDITKQKETEENLRNSERLLKQSQKVANLGTYLLDFKSMVWTSSDILDTIWGIDESYVRDYEGWLNLIHPEDKKDMANSFENNVLVKHEISEQEYRIKKNDTQEIIWVKDKGELEFDNDGNLLKMIGTVQDITPQKKSELVLQKAYTEVKQLKKQLEAVNVYLKEEISLAFNYEEMIYSSQEISEVLNLVEQVSSTNATVLILGETGTGKELIARAIHNTSDRKNNELIRVNCAAIPSELIESELFGHKKGSFTGAFSDRIGKFELADGGSIFLDEIGELPLELQPKLLRAIQEGEIEPVGSSKTHKLDVRIIAATNKDLKQEVENKRFREDLYFRLNVFPITIPPLRKRIEDIPILIDHFTNKYSLKYGKTIKYISDVTLQQMKSYPWPGNVRELENLVERAVIICNQDTLVFQGFDNSTQNTLIKQVNTTLKEVQHNHILKVLNLTHWKIDGKEGAAALLDIKPSTLRDRMKKLGIKRPKP